MEPQTQQESARAINLPLGRLVATPGALRALAEVGQEPQSFLRRHQGGDWGEVDQEDWAANDRAIADGERILSAYGLPDGQRLWIITEASRDATTLLLPEEY